ncbi:MAG TPA: hypothetical protein VH142_18570 [Polyangiaceae bacterium]|jgi:hypothetical protein|nr:hypothetical protein [Polyangiaceae bacterium]
MRGVQFTNRRRTGELLRLFLEGAHRVLGGDRAPSILTTASGVLDVAHVEHPELCRHAYSDLVVLASRIRFPVTEFFGGSEAGAPSAAE